MYGLSLPCHWVGGSEFIDKLMLLNHSNQFCMSAYGKFYDGVPLDAELVKQYQVDDDDLKHLLLSPGACLHPQGYECCESCYRSLRCSKKKNDDKLPTFDIANGFAIGHIPDTLKFKDKHGEVKT
jgi:hypothetical protein